MQLFLAHRNIDPLMPQTCVSRCRGRGKQVCGQGRILGGQWVSTPRRWRRLGNRRHQGYANQAERSSVHSPCRQNTYFMANWITLDGAVVEASGVASVVAEPNVVPKFVPVVLPSAPP